MFKNKLFPWFFLCVLIWYLFVSLNHIGWFLVLKVVLGIMYSLAVLCFCSALFLKSVEYSGDFLQVSIFHVQEFHQGMLTSAGSRGTVMYSLYSQGGCSHSPAPMPGQALVHRGNFWTRASWLAALLSEGFRISGPSLYRKSSLKTFKPWDSGTVANCFL